MVGTSPHALRLNHLYIDPPEQHHGVGHQVLLWLCAEADRLQLPIELCALKGSKANRFYLRHGFVAVGEGDWDIDYLLPAPERQRQTQVVHVDAARSSGLTWALMRAVKTRMRGG